MSEISPPQFPAPRPATPSAALGAPAKDPLRHAAETFEAAFLAEMLRHAGLGRMPERFNGGPGEAGFSGTLVEEYANRIAAQGGIGLAEQIYRSLAARGGG